MCGIFGFSFYGNTKISNLNSLTTSLAQESASRGTDATGIAYNYKNKLSIIKDGKSAYQIRFKHGDSVGALIGHTRHSTQGSEKKNINNHPFIGNVRGSKFALAHNGVLSNDTVLRKKINLPKTKIETDSYIAVQLIEQKKQLDLDTLKYMAQTVEGSFSFSVLDEKDNIYLVKGDSPLAILHFPKLKMYVYASTEQILWKALVDTTLFKYIKCNDFEEIKIGCGDILKICKDGTLVYDKFNYTDYMYLSNCNWWSYNSSIFKTDDTDYNEEYLEQLKTIAACQGYDSQQIEDLYQEGFSIDEIEEFLYTGDLEV